MEELNQKIAQIEAWLRDHPYIDWIARHDKITELAELKEQLKTEEYEHSNIK